MHSCATGEQQTTSARDAQLKFGLFRGRGNYNAVTNRPSFAMAVCTQTGPRMILQCTFQQPSLSMHFVCSTQRGTESLSKQTLCCAPYCRLPLCTPLPQGNFKPFLAAKGKNIPRNYSRQSRSSPHIELRATAEQPSQQEVYEYITLFKVTYCMNV